MIEIENLKPFPKFCYTIGMIPTSYKESLTYEEQLIWFCSFLQDTVIPTVNNNGQAVQELQNLYVQLKNYVDNYFENLDVQEEINNKLDDMAESGQLAEIIAEYVALQGLLVYNTVADMKQATNLNNGSFAETYGFYSVGDKGSAKYKIRTKTINDVINDITIIGLNDETLIAELIPSKIINAKQYGFNQNQDNTQNATLLFQNKKVYFDEGTFMFDNINITHNIEIIGNNTILKPKRTAETNNRFNTMFTFSNNIEVSIKNISFEGYIDAETESGTIPEFNSLIEASNCNLITVENCKFSDFDESYIPNVPDLMINRKGVLFTIHDTLKTNFINNSFDNIKGEEMIYCIDNELNRTQINMDFIKNSLTNIYTSGLDFIGNILNLKENYYNSTYNGSCLNCFALYLYVENEEINGSFNNVYDNCEEVFFQGKNASFKNIVNNASITGTVFMLSAENCLVDNFTTNNGENVEHCYRNYFGTNNSTLHKDCSTSSLSKCYAKISNSSMIAKHCIFGNNNVNADYVLLVENSELKSLVAQNTYTIASSVMNLILLNNIIHTCLTGGANAYTVLYNRSANQFKNVRAINNKIVHTSSGTEYFIVDTIPNYVLFIGNETSVANTRITSNLANVKAFGNYNYQES